MANYNNINISKSFLESKRNAYDMGQDGNQSYIVSTFAILNNISESKSRFILNDHIFTEFLKSNKSNFDSFVLQEMKYKKEDTMIGSDIPQSVRPERPIDDEEEDYKESLYEEDENDIDINDEYDIEENDSEDTDSDTSNLPPTVIQFLKDTKLLNASDKEAKTFLLRFKDVLTEAIDNESAIQLIILLLYKAKFEPETMSSGEIEELEDIVFNFTNEPDSDTSEDDNEIQESYYKSLFEDEPKKKKKTDSDDKTSKLDKINKVKDDIGKEVSNTIKSSVKSAYDKYPITSVLVGGAALIGIGSLALLGWYMFSKLSDIEYKKAKQKLIDEDIISDIQKGEIQNIKTTIESSDVIPKDQIETDDSDSDTSQDEDEPRTDDSSDDLDYPRSTINPVDGDSTTQIDSDTSNSDTSNEVSDFDSYIEEVKENESELKAELVSDTKERLQDESVRQEANKLRDKKRKYNKRNAEYWDKDKVKKDKPKDKKGKGDTSKDKKKPIKKKPDVIQKGKDTKKPDTSKSKKPIDKKGDTSKKKPNVIQKGKDKKGDTSKKPVDKKSDTKPKPNENVDAYKKRTGNTKVPKGYMTDPKTKRITKKKENYEHYKILF